MKSIKFLIILLFIVSCSSDDVSQNIFSEITQSDCNYVENFNLPETNFEYLSRIESTTEEGFKEIYIKARKSSNEYTIITKIEHPVGSIGFGLPDNPRGFLLIVFDNNETLRLSASFIRILNEVDLINQNLAYTGYSLNFDLMNNDQLNLFLNTKIDKLAITGNDLLEFRLTTDEEKTKIGKNLHCVNILN